MIKLALAFLLTLVLAVLPVGPGVLAQSPPTAAPVQTMPVQPVPPSIGGPPAGAYPRPAKILGEFELLNFGFNYTLTVMLGATIVGAVASNMLGTPTGTLIGAIAGAAAGSMWFLSQYAGFYFRTDRSDYRG